MSRTVRTSGPFAPRPHLDPPPPRARATPCLTAFSTRGCRISVGTSARRASGSTSTADLELALEADLHDLEIAGEEGELPLQRPLGLRAVLERRAQELAEARDHPAHAGGIAVDEGGHGVQGVEQEVRVELHAQGGELGLRELGPQAAASACRRAASWLRAS